MDKVTAENRWVVKPRQECGRGGGGAASEKQIMINVSLLLPE